MDLKRKDDIEVLSGQLVAQNMMLQIMLGQSVLLTADAGAELRGSIEAGLAAIKGNPNMTDREKFGCEKTLEDAIDTIDQVQTLAGLKTR
jgi:hypothetical protein